MAGQTDFKHITVNPAEPDDIVIHAGAPRGDSQPSGEGSAEDVTAHTLDHPSSESLSDGASTPPTSSSQASSAYRATTLEDIQGFKMSKTQIAVIIIALAAIVAFVVWYLVFS